MWYCVSQLSYLYVCGVHVCLYLLIRYLLGFCCSSTPFISKTIFWLSLLWPPVHIHNNVLYHWSSCEVTLPSTLAAMLSEALFSSWSIVLYSLMYSVYNDSVILWECFDRFTTLLFYYNLSSSDSSHTTSVYSTISVYHHYDFICVNSQHM